ncbi:MAG: nucleotide exchange factor GrpE [Alphaproteobacteria bacterium]|nr:nucleotide exchange factor GrpE [Alphaproteobacteria bacterium]
MLEDENLNNTTVENETSAPEDEAALSSEGIKEEDLSAANTALKDQLLRTMAELENYRKRAEREREEMAKFAITGFARELLTVSDNLRRALESVPAEHEKPEELLKILVEGVEITEKELLTVFKRHGIEKIEPLGQPFDHHLHQAMFELEDSDQPAGTVVQLMQPGYSLNGRLLRPALVGVSK